VKQGEFAQLVAGLSDTEVASLIADLPPHLAWSALHDWRLWARPEQLPPPGDWSTWVLMAGRGFGKTRAGAEWVAEQVRGEVKLQIALVAATFDEARDVMVEGQSGLRQVAGHLIAKWTPSRRHLLFTNGSEARLFSGASPESFRGPEHHIAWCDELAKWKKARESWEMLQMGLRLGTRPRALITTIPRGGGLLQELLADEGTVRTGGSTYANPHLADSFREQMERLYGGTHLGRQELEGELISGVPGALWTAELIHASRWPEGEPLPPLTRVAIGVDPPSGDGTCGIVACGLDAEGRGHVLADHSVSASRPERWAAAVAEAAALHGERSADGRALVVAEQNQGGAMVRSVLLGAAPDLHVRLVNATQGKSHRAEPVALRFEAGRAFLHGKFPPLEGQLLGFIAGGGYDGPGHSPDRADAMVWALTELMLGRKKLEPAVRGI
jgi:phage terminase large subunit-like protein